MKELEIACSLGVGEMVDRSGEWRALFQDTLVERDAIPRGISLRLRRQPTTLSRLEHLVELEQQCCAWINWKITTGEEIVVEATAEHPDGTRLLAEWFGVAASKGDRAG